MKTRRVLDVAAALQKLAEDLELPPAWLRERSGELSEEAIEVRLAWLGRRARVGHEHVLAGVLGSSTVVWVRSGQMLVREYVGMNVHEV